MIEAAAIKTADGRVWSVPRPLRHDACFRAISDGLQVKDDQQRWVAYTRGHIQGFVTDAGEFLDREAALDHAVANGQLLRPQIIGSVLTSEDLWSLDFGKALGFLRQGLRLTRYGWRAADRGWNSTVPWVVLQKGYPKGIEINKNTSEATGIPVGTVCRFSPYLMMRTANGDFVPWTPSQTDVLADDWDIVAP